MIVAYPRVRGDGELPGTVTQSRKENLFLGIGRGDEKDQNGLLENLGEDVRAMKDCYNSLKEQSSWWKL